MTYRSRPVWTFPVNWSSQPEASVACDPRELQLGFGRPSFERLRRHVLRGWRFTLTLATAAAVADFEAFADEAKGTLRGFWMPVPHLLSTVAEGVSPTVFRLGGFGLAETWAEDATAHLLVTSPGGTTTAAAITGVATSGALDEVTIDTALGDTPGPGWAVRRLVYVRFADDKEQANVIGEGRQERTINVVELPEEVAAVETGDEPVFLYRFFRRADGGEESFRFTSFIEDVTSGGQVFAARNLTHGEIVRALGASSESVTVTAVHDAGDPWATTLPYVQPLPLWVEISQAPFSDPDAATVLFTGREGRSAKFTGRKVELTFASWLDALESRVPHRLFGPRCPHALYGPACGVDPAAFTTAATVVSTAYMQLTVHIGATAAADAFAGGDVALAAPRLFRSILSSSADDGAGNVTLTLNAPVPPGVAPGAAVNVRPGCNKTWAGCTGRFGNDRFGGTPFVPRQNLSFAVADVSGVGGKKGA